MGQPGISGFCQFCEIWQSSDFILSLKVVEKWFVNGRNWYKDI